MILLQRRKILSAYEGGPLAWRTVMRSASYDRVHDVMLRMDTDPEVEFSIVDEAAMPNARRRGVPHG